MIEFIIEYWLSVVFVCTLSLIGFVYRHCRNKLYNTLCEHDIIKSGLLVIIRAELVKSYHYYMEKGYCPIYARDTINPMFNEYLKLGGNGTIPDLMEELNNLPTDKKYIKELV